MGKRKISDSEEESKEEEEDIIQNISEDEQNLEQEVDEDQNSDDSFDKKNEDILNGSSDESEKDEINAWGTDRKRFYKMGEEVS